MNQPQPRLPAPNKPEAKTAPLNDDWWVYVGYVLGVVAIALYLVTT